LLACPAGWYRMTPN